MTDLRQLGDIALKMARSNLAKNKAAGLTIVFAYPDGTTHQLPPDLCEILSHGLNDGRAKDVIFNTTRMYAHRTGAEAVVIATEAWRGRSTEAARDMPHEEFERLSKERGFETLLQMGMVERSEVLIATAQNAERMVMTSQPFRRLDNGEVYSYGEVEVEDGPQSDFRGRQKMFGDLKEENLR